MRMDADCPVVGRRRRQRLRRTRAGPRHPTARRRTVRRPHRRRDRCCTPDRVDDPAGRGRHRARFRHRLVGPGDTPPSGPSRRSGSRSTESSTLCPTRSTRRSTPSHPAAGSPSSRTTRVRTASSRSGSGRPRPVAASARPSCRACVVRSRPCASCGGSPSDRRSTRSRCQSARRLGSIPSRREGRTRPSGGPADGDSRCAQPAGRRRATTPRRRSSRSERLRRRRRRSSHWCLGGVASPGSRSR